MENAKKASKRGYARKIDSDDSVALKEPVMTFKAFFDQEVAFGKYKPHQERELAAFCKDLNLNVKETADTFRKTLEKY